MGYSSQDEFARDLEEIQRRSYERQKAIESGLGIKTRKQRKRKESTGLIP